MSDAFIGHKEHEGESMWCEQTFQILSLMY